MRILSRHPQVTIGSVTGRSEAGKRLRQVFPHLRDATKRLSLLSLRTAMWSFWRCRIMPRLKPRPPFVEKAPKSLTSAPTFASAIWLSTSNGTEPTRRPA